VSSAEDEALVDAYANAAMNVTRGMRAECPNIDEFVSARDAARSALLKRLEDLRVGLESAREHIVCLRAVGSVLWAKQARFPEWVRGLARWGPDVQVRAAIAGVDACGPFSWPVGARERLLEWVSGSRDTRETLALMDWAAGNGMNVGADLQPWHWSFLQAESSQQSPYAMSRAVGSAGEPTIRSAIQSALILYALGEP